MTGVTRTWAPWADDEEICALVRATVTGMPLPMSAGWASFPQHLGPLREALVNYVRQPVDLPMDASAAYGRVQRAMAVDPTRPFFTGQLVITKTLALGLLRGAGDERKADRVTASPAILFPWTRGTIESLTKLLARHEAGDWGAVDAEDAAENDASLREGRRLLSSYDLQVSGDGEEPARTIWVITEWDRSKTTFMYPEDY